MYGSGLRLLVWDGPFHSRENEFKGQLSSELPLLPWALCNLMTLDTITVHIAVDFSLVSDPKTGR